MHSTTHISHTCAVCNWVDQTSRGDAGCLNSCLDVIPRTSRHKDSHVCLFWPWKTTKIQKGWPKIVHMEGRKYKLWRSNYFNQTLYLLDRKKTLQILLSNYTVMNASFLCALFELWKGLVILPQNVTIEFTLVICMWTRITPVIAACNKQTGKLREQKKLEFLYH